MNLSTTYAKEVETAEDFKKKITRAMKNDYKLYTDHYEISRSSGIGETVIYVMVMRPTGANGAEDVTLKFNVTDYASW